jgi:septal ring factor EnvC (AmiA/AmiB activator)
MKLRILLAITLLLPFSWQHVRAQGVPSVDVRGRMLMEILDVLQRDLARLTRQRRELGQKRERLEKELHQMQDKVSALQVEGESTQLQIGQLLRSLAQLKPPDDVMLLLGADVYQDQHLYRRTVQKVTIGLAKRLRQLMDKRRWVERQFVQNSRELQLIYSEHDRLEKELKELDQTISARRADLVQRTERVAAVENLFMTPSASLIADPEDDIRRPPKPTTSQRAESFADHRGRRSLKIPISPGRVAKPFERLPEPPFGTEKMVRGWILVSLEEKVGSAKVRSPFPGTVSFVGEIPGYGRILVLDHGNGFHSVYGNLHRCSLLAGDSVKMGEVIATVVSDPASKVPPYLYFELRENRIAIDPKPFFLLRPVKAGN